MKKKKKEKGGQVHKLFLRQNRNQLRIKSSNFHTYIPILLYIDGIMHRVHVHAHKVTQETFEHTISWCIGACLKIPRLRKNIDDEFDKQEENPGQNPLSQCLRNRAPSVDI